MQFLKHWPLAYHFTMQFLKHRPLAYHFMMQFLKHWPNVLENDGKCCEMWQCPMTTRSTGWVPVSQSLICCEVLLRKLVTKYVSWKGQSQEQSITF